MLFRELGHFLENPFHKSSKWLTEYSNFQPSAQSFSSFFAKLQINSPPFDEIRKKDLEFSNAAKEMMATEQNYKDVQ